MFCYPFAFDENTPSQARGALELDEPLPFNNRWGSGFYRPGQIRLEGRANVELVLYHSQATASFIYTRNSPADSHMLEIAGLTADEIAPLTTLPLPGQLCLGADRARLIGQAINDIFSAPALSPTFSTFNQHNLAVFPIAREGLKYQVADAIYENYGYYVDEVILDAHHVFDSSVPVYNRKVEMTLFKDKDLDQQQRQKVRVAFLADSIASGLVMKEVITRVHERFENIQQVEVVAPLATIRGLCRIALPESMQNIKVRVHVFETILNALPPDFYYSAHFNIPELHIRPDLEAEYRNWWGKDSSGAFIADTACAGYGWSEVFYSPRKQIEMMNNQLKIRHNLSVADLIRRNANHKA